MKNMQKIINIGLSKIRTQYVYHTGTNYSAKLTPVEVLLLMNHGYFEEIQIDIIDTKNKVKRGLSLQSIYYFNLNSEVTLP